MLSMPLHNASTLFFVFLVVVSPCYAQRKIRSSYTVSKQIKKQKRRSLEQSAHDIMHKKPHLKYLSRKTTATNTTQTITTKRVALVYALARMGYKAHAIYFKNESGFWNCLQNMIGTKKITNHGRFLLSAFEIGIEAVVFKIAAEIIVICYTGGVTDLINIPLHGLNNIRRSLLN